MTTYDPNSLWLVKYTFIDKRGNVIHAKSTPYQAAELSTCKEMFNTNFIVPYVKEQAPVAYVREKDDIVINSSSNDLVIEKVPLTTIEPDSKVSKARKSTEPS